MPGLYEVAFARSPLAHARITAIDIPASLEGSLFTRERMDARDIVADSTLPSYQSSAQPPLAHGKVRFVGEPVVMAVATTRALAEDILESIAIEYDDLPVYGRKFVQKNQKCGTFGDIAVLSFNGNKIITTSGGGAMVTHTKALKDKGFLIHSS